MYFLNWCRHRKLYYDYPLDISEIIKNIDFELPHRIIIFKWSDLILFEFIFSLSDQVYTSINNYYLGQDIEINELNHKIYDYFWIKDWWELFVNLLNKTSIWCINQTTLNTFKDRWYKKIHYIPRWINKNVFFPFEQMDKNSYFHIWIIVRSEFIHKWSDLALGLKSILGSEWIKLSILDNSQKVWDKIKRTEMCFWYNNLDLFVILSKKEWWPNSLLEAWACNVPIISTDVWYAKEILWIQEIMDKSNDIEYYVNKILCIKNNYREYQEKSDLVYKKIQNDFLWEKQIIYYKKFLNL